jgi:hypothetical protein
MESLRVHSKSKELSFRVPESSLMRAKGYVIFQIYLEENFETVAQLRYRLRIADPVVNIVAVSAFVKFVGCGPVRSVLQYNY